MGFLLRELKRDVMVNGKTMRRMRKSVGRNENIGRN